MRELRILVLVDALALVLWLAVGVSVSLRAEPPLARWTAVVAS